MGNIFKSVGKIISDNINPIMQEAQGTLNGILNKNSMSSDDSNVLDSSLFFRVPNWTYADFIAERTSFQKGFDSATGDPGWFYFKIFFRFDTGNGLFGGVLGEEDMNGEMASTKHSTGDSAINYLKRNVEHYSKSHMQDRADALTHFCKMLSFLNSRAPWFFDSISGLDRAAVVDFKDPMKERYLELGFREDAVDMRITTLLDLYKYACFDYVNLKEVVPENLRQFDMVVILFHTPLRWYHTAMHTMRRGSFPYKGIAGNDMENRMTYKMFTFKGCQFVHESLGSVYPGEMSNENAFSLAKSKIQISYKRVYQHTFNEWGRFFMGDDGIYWNDPNGQSQRLAAIVDAKENPYYWNPGAEIFKPLVDASEAKCIYAARQVKPEIAFGNLYLDYTDVDGDYFKMKLHDLKRPTDPMRGEMTNNMRNALHDQGLFRNVANAVDNASNAFNRVTSGNFF